MDAISTVWHVLALNWQAKMMNMEAQYEHMKFASLILQNESGHESHLCSDRRWVEFVCRRAWRYAQSR